MTTQTRVKFAPKNNNLFFQELRKRVDTYFETNQIDKHGNGSLVLKTIVLLCAYLIPYALLSVNHSVWIHLTLSFIMGIAVAGIGMSVMHDAIHGAYSKHAWVNTLFGSTLNLLGGSVLNWKLQHNILHHTYTNVTHLDEDIADRLILKFSPHTPVKAYHKYQWMYVFFFYGLITLNWYVTKDFVQYRLFIRNGINNQTPKENAWFLVKLILLKIGYGVMMLGVPIFVWHLPVSWVIGGFLLMHFVAGIILSTVFQLAHTVEHTHHPMPNDKGQIENEWAIHQLETTANFSPNNKWLGWYVGGLNYQIEHHLFPKISHIHYPALSSIVKQTAEEYGIRYIQNDTFGKALSSHIRLLKDLGVRVPDFQTTIN